MTEAKVLVIDDNTAVLGTLKIVLRNAFSTVTAVSNPKLIPALVAPGDVDAVLLDMNFGSDRLDGHDGLFWLDRIMNRSGLDNPPAVVMITAFGDIDLAVTCLKNGAMDFIQKPWDNNDLIRKLTEAINKRRNHVCDAAQNNPEPYRDYAVQEERGVSEPSSLEEIEKMTIRRVIESCGRNLTIAAERLGISRQTLYNKMKHYGFVY